MKTKKLKFMATVGLVVLFLISSVMTISTMAQEASRVTAVLSTDKESYVNGETAALQLTVTNGYNYKLDNVTAEISVPEEMKVQTGIITENVFSLEAGESKTNNVTLLIQGKSDVPNADNPQTGDSGWGLWAVLAALSGAAMVALILKGKNKKKIMALFLCLAMLLTSVPLPVSAADLVEPSVSVTAEKEVMVNGIARTIKATITYNEKAVSEDDTVTITFESFEGTPVDAITVEKGEEPGRLPQSYQTGKAFMGWYSDEELTEPFFSDTKLTENITLYASFCDVDDEVKIASNMTYYEEDCDASMPITLICDEEITADNLQYYMTLYAFTGEVPANFTVTKNGTNEYTIVPNTPYNAGCQYRMAIPEGVKFKGLEETVNEYTFRIYKDECEIVDLDDDIKYVEKNKFELTDTEYKFKVSKSYVEEKSLAVEDTICIGDGTNNYSKDILFTNIVKLEEFDDYYYVYVEDSDIEDVFDDVDIYFKKAVENDYLKEDFNPKALEQELYMSEAADQLNLIMAAMLADSPEVAQELGGVSLLSAIDETMLDFSDYAYLDRDRKFNELKASLKNMMTITVTIGSAKNDNFDMSYYKDKWSVLTFEFKWKGTIKDKLMVDATFTISEYMAVSLQGYKSLEFKLFELPQLEFDYAANVYTQTDIAIKILVCSVDKKNDGYKDISKKIDKLFSSDKANDTDSLVAEVQEMLEKKGDYIELCEIPFFSTETPLGIFSLNLEFAFVVKVNFAAGLSSSFSVLDAVQIGARGNSADGSFDMYKNKLWGGDRYSFDLSVCGYLGVKMGIRGSFTVSFLGLKRLGEVGVSVEVGAYLDMYGYAQYHIVKPRSNYPIVHTTLYGGFYMEAGIYLEVKLIAKSAIFKVKAEVSLLDEKWPLFSMGKKDLLITLNDLNTPIMIDSKGSNSGSIELSDAPALTGRTLDLTTGKINENAIIPWSSVVLRFSNRNFSERIEYRKYSTGDTDSSAESMVDVYYKGQTLQFTKKADNGVRTAAKAKVIWYDSTRVKEEDIGKIFKVNFYLELDGEKTLLGSRNVLAGNYLGYCSYPELNNPKYAEGKWNKDPLTTIINKDMDFVYSAKTAQVRAVFTYFDDETKQWKAEMKVINVGEVPTVDAKYENEHMKIYMWETLSGGGLDYSNMSSTNGNYVYKGWGYGLRNYSSAIPSMERSITKEALLTGHSTSEILHSVTGESAQDALENMVEKYGDECKLVSYFYTPHYTSDKVNVTYTMLDGNGNTVTYTTQVFYGSPFVYSSATVPYWMKFKGFSSDGGKTVYYHKDDFPNLYEDTTYEAIYEPITHKVTLQYYDSETNTFKDYKTYDIRRGLTVPQEYFDEAESAYIWEDGVSHTTFGWINAADGSSAKSPIFEDTTMRLSFRRSVKIVLDPGEGTLLFEGVAYSFDTNNYQLTIGMAAKKQSDEYNDYKQTGWKNQETGEIYGVDDLITIYNPVTLTAVFTAVPKTYNLIITTDHGTLKNGEKEINVNVDYDTYNSMIAEYRNWQPADCRDDENHCTYVVFRTDVYTLGNTCTITYQWTNVVDKHNITIDVNGGTYSGSTTIEKEWNTEIDLSGITATKEDDFATWKMSNWTDKAGNVYSIDGKYLVTGDDTLKINWEVDTYKEYTVTFELDGIQIGFNKYHKNDVLETFGKPTEADGKIFSGWTWYNSNGEEITACTNMPAENLTLKGTTSNVYIKYVVDGQEITEYEEVGSIGHEETVRDLYEKTGYTANPWTTTDVTVDENGNFTMPEHDVTFTTTTSKNSYKVTYYHNNAIYNEQTVAFGDYVLLIDVPVEDGAYYAWTSEDATLTNVGFSMPAQDVVIESMASETQQYIIYYVNDEIIDYDIATPGQTIMVSGMPIDDKYIDMNFSGWYVGNRKLDDSDGPAMLEVGNEPIHIYGYFTEGTTKVKIYFDENVPRADLVLYGNVGDTIKITMLMDDHDLAGFKVNGEVVSEISITGTDDIDAYVQYTDKSYTVSYNGEGFVLPDISRYNAGDIVELPDLPGDTSSVSVKGWFVAGVDIMQDTNGQLYFIMPARDVVVNLMSQAISTSLGSGKTASVYINSPYSDEPVFLMDYNINSDENQVYFDAPQIAGYEFIGWKDEDGNIVAGDNLGITLSDMNGINRKFYGEYRKVELHIIEFEVDGDIVAFRAFYDTYIVEVTSPEVEVGPFEELYWYNDFFETTIENGKVLFNTGDRMTYQYAKQDFIFVAQRNDIR